jgi:hypothetical protein
MTKRGHVLKTATLPPSVKDLVDTPHEPVDLLVPYLARGEPVSEPCAGAYRLAARLEHHGIPVAEAYDVAPRDLRVEAGNATTRVPKHVAITNPPYSRASALPILMAACRWPNTSIWLVPHDWIANAWCAPFMKHVAAILPVGRVRWIEGTTSKGFENTTWIWITGTPASFILPRIRSSSSRRSGRSSKISTTKETT